MEDPLVREVESVLVQALDKVVLTRGPTAPQMTLADYRYALQRCRRHHDPDRHVLISGLVPDVEESATRDRLLEIVRRELSDHIEDDRAHSGTCVVGGASVAGTPVDEILQNLLVRSIADSPAVAARAFAACVAATSFSFSHFVVLTSLTLDAPVDLFDQVRLIPLPATRGELPPFMPTVIRHGGDTETVLSRVVLCVEKTVKPVFHRPTGESPRSHFRVATASEDLGELDLRALCQAISLASGCSVRPTMQWNALLDYEIFDLRTDRGIGTTGWGSASPHVGLLHSPLSRRQGTLTEEGRRGARQLYDQIVRLDPKVREGLQIPIERWMRSMEQWEMVDGIIDLGIALESLYVRDGGGEVTFKLALTAAWHLADDRPGRKRLYELFKKIYGLRSDAVHGREIKRNVTVGGQAMSTHDLVREAQKICREAICAVLRAEKLPDRDKLILG